jgi:murein DD-endopeptidase MepM/ murein hydrolase activator NlpD
MRRKNNQQLADLRFKTEEKILWNGPFLHWGKEESLFADVRNYMYQGKKVDQQVHLGFDLSDTANAPVHVANDGRVVWAADLGIYGNCVVVDHGYALQSIYGHMNRIDVKVGHGPGRRRPRSLQHADRWRTGESARMVGRALDPRSDPE